MNTKKLLIDFIFVLIIFILVSIFSDKNPILAGIPTCLCIFGVCWIIITILTLPCQSWIHSMTAIIISLCMILISSPFLPTNPKKIYTEDQIGNYEDAEWIIRIHYDDNYGMSTSTDYKYRGATDRANNYMTNKVAKWKRENSPKQPTSYEKILYYIPKEYAKKNGYPETYCQRY